MDILQVAIPTYNRSDYLAQLLSSIPNDITVSVSDNGSFTHQEVKDRYPNTIFKSHTDVLPVFKNWNSALENIEAEWVVMPSDDDIFLDGAFKTISKYLLKYEDCDILIFGHQIINELNSLSAGWVPDSEKVIDAPNGYDLFKYGVNARMPSVVFKYSAIKKLGFFDSKYELTAGDSDLIQRVLLTGKVAFIPEVISAYRIWNGALTSQRIGTKLWLSEIDYWQKKITEIGTKQYMNLSTKPNFKRIKDEVYASNLIGGLKMLKKSSSFSAAVRFLLSNRYPWQAGLGTHKNILKSLLF